MATLAHKGIATLLFLALLLPVLLQPIAGYAQPYSITGNTCVMPGSWIGPYTINGGPWSSTDKWCVTGGATLGGTTNSCIANGGAPSVGVTWGSSGTATLSYYHPGTATTPVATLTVTIQDGGSLSPGAFMVPTGMSTTISITGPPATGCGGSYNFSWIMGTSTATATSIGGNTQNLTITNTWNSSMEIWRVTNSSNMQGVAYSNPVAVVCQTPFTPGTVSPATQTILSGGTPGMLTATASTGGVFGPNYFYQWQSSPDNTTWTNVGTSTMNGGFTYSPPALSATTYYRQAVTTGPLTMYTNVATVNVVPALTTGTITTSPPTIANNTSPGLISCTAATGGACSPNYVYQWQSSPDNSTWSNVPSTGPDPGNGQNYTPGNLTSSLYFRRQVSCSGQNPATAPILVTVTPPLTGGTIASPGSPISFETPASLTNVQSPTGGNCGGVYHYQWYQSGDGNSFQPISGANSATYTTANLTFRTWFIRQVSCGAETVNSNTISVQVNGQLNPGQITPGSLNIASGTSPGLLLANPATGGGCSGSGYTYLWYYSPDGTNYYSTGAMTQNYTPGPLSGAFYYKRQVQCGSVTAYTNVCTVVAGTAPTTVDMNYTRTRMITRPGIVDLTSAAALTSTSDVQQTTQYFDGMGRTVQTVAMQQSPLGKDLVSMQVYDGYGREAVRYTPYISPTSDGNFKVNALSEQNTFSTAQFPGEQYFYSQTDYELSPLGRPLNTYAPGNNWVGSSRAMSKEQLVNTSLDLVRQWAIAAAQGSLPTSAGVYAAGTLYKSVSTDEQGHQTIVFKDTYGQTILKKTQNTAAADDGSGSPHTGWLCTYYVYDDLGNMRFVITPDMVQLLDGNSSITQTMADELGYRYEYDLLDRMIIKKIPGTPSGSGGEQWMVYDTRNRLVMRQDGNQRPSSQWTCYLYDGMDRPVMEGTITYAGTEAQLQTAVTTASQPNTNTVISNVTVNSSPLPAGVTITPLSVLYYDNYAWVAGSGTSLTASIDQTNSQNASWFNTTYNSSPTYALPISQAAQTQGLQTGKMTQVLGSATQFLYTLNFYDDRGRVNQTQSTNIRGGKDVVTNQYSFNSKLIQTLAVYTKSGTNPQTQMVGGALSYDAGGRILTIVKTVNSTINGVAVNAGPVTIVNNHYNELGQLSNKTLGNSLETLAYDYNIRGWLLGVNRVFAKTAGSTTNYFGYDLGYDNGNILTAPGGSTIGSYANPSFNGNVSGTVWKSIGDGKIRKYDYSYDAADRLTAADFNQQDGAAFDKTAGIDFSVSNLSYDANGNLQSMNQNGWLLGGSQQIDQIAYHYLNGGNSNRLMNVMDNSAYNVSTPASTLGDLHYSGTKNAGTSTDYGYDNNGNATSDVNRSVSSITYNFLNLPVQVTVTGKGTIVYQYDAAGNKLSKTTTDNSVAGKTVTTTTTYIGEQVYQSRTTIPSDANNPDYTDVLLYIGHEEGRVRFKPALGNIAASFVFDYFIKDYLGNVRMVLTDEQQQDIYPAATLETNSISTEQNYYSITNDAAHVVPVNTLPWFGSLAGSNYVDSNTVNNPGSLTPGAVSAQMYKLNGLTGDKYGLGITIKVMAGDKISIFGKSVWHNTGTNPGSYPISSVLSAFINSFGGTSAVANGGHGAVTGATLNSAIGGSPGPLYNLLGTTPGQSNPGTAPKAAINWILFDDRFNPVSVGTDLVSSTGDLIKTHSLLNLPMVSNGYLYVYCSNESDLDVYFDNLQVVNTRGPILEETHYYPAGLTMAGISDHAWNKMANFRHYQGKEMQDQEFGDGTGLEEYDFTARMYDPQLGVWHNPDPAGQYASPYLGMGNNWPNGRDPNGQWFGLDDIIVSVVGFIVGYVGYGLETHHWGGKALLSGLIGAAIAEGGYLTLGGGLAATAPASSEGALISTASTEAIVTGGTGTMSAAVSFSATYAATDAASLLQNSGQLQSDSWATLGLIAGYSAMASIQAGFQSDHMQGIIDDWAGTQNGALPTAISKGALSNGLGGAISNMGNTTLQAYNPTTHSWKAANIGDILYAGWVGFSSNYFAQIGHNLVNTSTFLKNFVGKTITTALSNATNAITQQYISNLFYFPQKKPGDDLFSTNSLLNGTGGWPNDLMGDD